MEKLRFKVGDEVVIKNGPSCDKIYTIKNVIDLRWFPYSLDPVPQGRMNSFKDWELRRATKLDKILK